MTQPYNALYGPPTPPVDNALYYDDTQGMPRSRPADPLRWLAEAVGQNKDLPAPQFFMDPRALSLRNMLHAGLNTSANWLDGTKDQSALQVGPDTIAPLGMMGMGAALKPASGAAKPSLAKKALQQHMRAQESVYGPLTGPKHLAHLAESAATAGMGAYAAHGLMGVSPTAAATLGGAAAMIPHAVHIRDVYKRLKEIDARDSKPRSESVTLLADNAKGSAPGTVVNSMAPKEVVADYVKRLNDTFRDPDQFPAVMKELEADPRVTQAEAVQIASEFYAPIAGSTSRPKALQHAMKRHEKLMESRRASGTIGKLTADNAKGSAPGTVINSLDMSEAARMQRAREMGFDMETPLYHGTKADFDEFRPSEKGKFGAGVYFSPERQFADEWTSGNGRVIEAYGRGRMADDAAWKAAMDAEYKANPSRSMFDVEVAAGERLQREGFDGVASKARGETVIFNPSHIRSPQAAFDPAKRDSANLLAASPSASAPGLAANSTQQDDQGVMSILRKYGLMDQ